MCRVALALVLLPLLACGAPLRQAEAPRFALALHGGAGVIPRDTPPAEREAYLQGLQAALREGRDRLARGEPALLLPAYGKSWPSTRVWVDANGNYPVEVRFIAGYGTAGTSVPETFRQAMLLLIGHWYENREEVSESLLSKVPTGAEALLWMDRFHPW